MLPIIQGNDAIISVILHQQAIQLASSPADTAIESHKIDLSRVKELSVRLIPYMRWAEVSPEFSIRDNVLEVSFPASSQKPGKWDIEISYFTPSDDGGYKRQRVKQDFAEVIPAYERAPGAMTSAYIVTAEVSSIMRGETGLDAYQSAIARGLVTSYEEWVEYIRGPKGDPGNTGKDAYAYYLETTTDSPKLSEEQWSNFHNHYLSILHRIILGENVPMQGQKSTGDYLLELHTTIDRLASALQAKDIDVREQSGLASFIPKIKAYEPMHIVLFKKTQLHGWVQEYLGRTIEVYAGWDNPDLEHAMSNSPNLKRIPDIVGAERTISVNSMLMKCPALQGVIRLPNLPKAISAESMANGCKLVEEVIIGDMPSCKSIVTITYECFAVRNVYIGELPIIEKADYAFASCRSLERVVFSGGIAPSKSADSMFNGDRSLISIDGVVDVSSIGGYISILSGCVSLKSVKIKGLGDHINLSTCEALSAESLRYLIDNAKEVTGKMIFLPRKFFSERKEEMETIGRDATAKGFTINYQ